MISAVLSQNHRATPCCHRRLFYHQVLRRIDVPVREVRWSDNGDLVALICDSAFYTLRFSPDAVDEFFATGQEPDEDGIEDAFELLNEVQERVRTGALAVLTLLSIIPAVTTTASPSLFSWDW